VALGIYVSWFHLGGEVHPSWKFDCHFSFNEIWLYVHVDENQHIKGYAIKRRKITTKILKRLP